MLTASWCGPCQSFKQFQFPKLVAAKWSIGDKKTDRLQLIDTDENPGAWAKYRGNYEHIPLFVVLEDDKVVSRVQASTAEQVLNLFNSKK